MDKHPFFQGEILWMGFKTKFIEYFREKENYGKFKMDIRKETHIFD